VFIYPEFIYFSLKKFKQKRTAHPQIRYSPLLPYVVSFQEDLAKETNAHFLAFNTSTTFRFSGNQKIIKEKFDYIPLKDALSNENYEFFQMRRFPHTLLIKELTSNTFSDHFHKFRTFIDVFHSFQENDPTFTYFLDYFFVHPHFQLRRILYYLDGENGTISFEKNEQEILLTIKNKTNAFSLSKDAALFLEDYLKKRQQGLRLKGQISPPRNYFDDFMDTLEDFSEHDTIQDRIHDELLDETNRDYKKIERTAQQYLNHNSNSKRYYLNNDRVVYFSFLEKTFILSCIDEQEEPFHFTSCPIESTEEEVEKAVMRLSKHQFNHFLNSKKRSNERF
jgi:hypothetical protein